MNVTAAGCVFPSQSRHYDRQVYRWNEGSYPAADHLGHLTHQPFQQICLVEGQRSHISQKPFRKKEAVEAKKKKSLSTGFIQRRVLWSFQTHIKHTHRYTHSARRTGTGGKSRGLNSAVTLHAAAVLVLFRLCKKKYTYTVMQYKNIPVLIGQKGLNNSFKKKITVTVNVRQTSGVYYRTYSNKI